jgi:hypothetical protein
MNDQNSFEPDVHALRVAAERGDPNACRDATEALLRRLPTDNAVRLTRDFVSRRLPAFERQHPSVHWPRELLETVTQEDSVSEGRSWPDDEFPGPGGNSFAKAVESLWIASLRVENAQQCSAELVNSLSWAIMTEKVEHWGSRHPREWALWYQLVWRDDDDPRKTDIMMAMAADPDVKRLARAGWLEVADRLEAALRETTGSAEKSGPLT